MSEPASTPPVTSPVLPALAGPANLRLGVQDLPKAFHAVACALGEAGIGGQQLPAVFATGVRATCSGCGMSVTGGELSELMVAATEEGEHRLPPKLERLRLGYCPRNGCEARFYTLELSPAGKFEPGPVLARAKVIMDGERAPLISLRPAVTPETRKATRRLALIALGTLFVAFVAYRLIYFRSQPIPFVEPKSPFTVEPASLPPAP